MNPEFTILTHFSQRYSRFLPLIMSREKVFTAFDHMTVPLSELHRLPALLPAVRDITQSAKDEGYAPVFWGW